MTQISKHKLLRILVSCTLVLFFLISETACSRANSYPLHVEDHIEPKKGLPQITIDADIKINEQDNLPLVEVRKRDFTYDDISSFIQYVGGNLCELYSTWVLSKTDWDIIIGLVQERTEHDYDVKNAINTLTQYKELAPTMNQKVPVELTDLSLDENNMIYCSTEKGDPSVVSFSGKNAYFSYFRMANSFVLGKAIYDDYMLNPDFNNDISWQAPTAPNIDYNAALNEANRWVDMFDMELELYSSEPCSIIHYNAIKNCAWKYVFTRKTGSLQSSYEDGSWYYINPSVLPKEVSPWGEEFCVIVIDDEGLFEIWWQGASRFIDSETINRIVPFSKIKRNCVSLLQQIYADDENYKHSIVIKSFVIESKLISSKDESKGVYLPAWKVEFENTYYPNESLSPEKSVIFINAQTGEYIEPRINEEQLHAIN